MLETIHGEQTCQQITLSQHLPAISYQQPEKNVILIILETIIINNKTIENKRHNYSTVLFRKEGRKDRMKKKGKEGGRKYGSSSTGYQFYFYQITNSNQIHPLTSTLSITSAMSFEPGMLYYNIQNPQMTHGSVKEVPG